MTLQAIKNFAFSIVAGVGLFGVILMSASSAHAQMTIRNDGVEFPDGTVQTTAAAATLDDVESPGDYAGAAFCSGNFNNCGSTSGGGEAAANAACISKFGPTARAELDATRLAKGAVEGSLPVDENFWASTSTLQQAPIHSKWQTNDCVNWTDNDEVGTGVLYRYRESSPGFFIFEHDDLLHACDIIENVACYVPAGTLP